MLNIIPHEPSQNVIAEGLEAFGIEIDLTAKELFDVAILAFSTSLYQAVKAGMAFMAAQQALKIDDSARSESPTFKSWIKAGGLSEQRVYENIKLAKGYLAIPSEQRKTYLTMGKRKAIKLASIDPEALADMAEKDPEMLGDYALLSRKQMAEKLNNVELELKTEKSRNSRQPQKRGTASPFLPRTEDIRAECLALQKESELTLNSLRKLFEEVNGDPHAPEWRYQIEQIWLTSCIAAAMAADTLHAQRETCQVGDLPDRVQSQHMMTPQEAKRWLQDAPLIESSYEGKKAAREELIEQAKPKGRGRPKKIKTGEK